MFRSKPTANRPRKLIASALFLALYGGAVLAGGNLHVDLPAQALSDSLRALAAQAGVQVVFTAETTGTAKAAPLNGDMSIEEALQKLLTGSELEFRRDGERSYVVVRATRSEHIMSEVVVTATKTERMRSEVPVAMNVVTVQEIAQKGATIDLSDALLDQAGMDVYRANPAGLGGISIRGLGSYAHSLVMIDGQPADLMNYSGRSPLQIIDPSNVDRVEIVRGAASSLYGSNAMSGVINIITKKGKGDGKSRVAIGYDSMRSPLASASTTGASGKLAYNLALRHYRTDGYNIFPGPEISWAQTTQKSDWGDDAIGANFSYDLAPGTEINMGLNYQDSFSHTRGWDNQSYFKQHFDTLEVRHSANEIYSVTANLSYRKHDAHYLWGYDPSSGITDELTEKTRLDVQNQFDFSAANRLIVGVDYGVESVDWVSMNSPGVLSDTAKSRDSDLGFYVQDELKPTERLFLTLGGRYDRFRYSNAQYMNYNVSPALTSGGNGDQSAFNPRLGARLQLTESTSLRTSSGTGFRAPTSSDRYKSTPWALGNPDLKPERSASIDLGLDHRFGNGLNVSATLFRINLTDAVTWYAQASGQWQPHNVNKSRSQGLELEAREQFGEHWSANFNYTYTNTKITQQDNDPTLVGHQMTYAPHNKANVAVVYDAPNQLTVRVDERYVGSMYANVQNSESGKLDAYVLTDVKATWHTVGGKTGLDISAAVTNLTDRTYYRFQPYWHEPGRVVSVEAAYKW